MEGRLRKAAQFAELRDYLFAAGIVALVCARDRVLKPLRLIGGDNFSATDHDTDQLVWLRVELCRQRALRPGAGQNIKNAETIFLEPGILPGIHHRLCLASIKTFAHKRLAEVRAQTRG